MTGSEMHPGSVPSGYDPNDYNKCVDFLEQTDENGVKNGEKLCPDYDPNDPSTWGTTFRVTALSPLRTR